MVAICLVFVFAGGCAGRTTPATADASAAPSQSSARGRDRNLLSREELSADPSMNSQSVLDALRLLRPQFLTQRGKNSHSDDEAGKVHVSIDGGRIIPLQELENIHAGTVLEIRYLNIAAAMQKFGGAAREGPVILVRMMK